MDNKQIELMFKFHNLLSAISYILFFIAVYFIPFWLTLLLVGALIRQNYYSKELAQKYSKSE